MQALKIGIIGAGRFATRRVLPCFENHPLAKLIVLHNRSLQKAKSLAEQFKAPHATNLEREVLETPSLDGVIICSPNYLHKNLILKALEKGLAVWVEKPPTLNALETKEILDLFPNPPLLVGQCYRFKSVLQEAKKQIQQGQIGELKSLDLHMHMTIPQTNWRATKRYGGGVLLELGIHLVDALHFLSDQTIAEVFAQGEFIQDDEKTSLVWELKSLGKTLDNTSFHLSMSFNAPYSTGFKVIGTLGELHGEFVFRAEEDDKEKLTFKNLEEKIIDIPLNPCSIFKEQLSHFCTVIQGKATDSTLLQGHQNMLVLDALERSLETNALVSIQEPAIF